MSSDKCKPIYVLVGRDVMLQDAAKEQVVGAVIGTSDPQVAVSSFDATAELSTVLDELRTMPFLAPRRAVIVRDAEAFVSAHRESLEKYLSSPSGNSSLVLMVSTWLPKSNLGKLVDKVGQVLDCTTPAPAALPGWLKTAAAKRKKKIAPEAAELLALWAGADLGLLDSEIEKLSLYVGQREVITVEDVSKLVTSSAGPAAFALTNAITASNVKAALLELGRVLSQRGEEFRALGSITWHLRRALAAQQALLAGLPPQRALPRMPYDAQAAFLAYIKRRPLAKLQQDFRRLLAADLGMKSGADATSTLTELVVQLCT